MNFKNFLVVAALTFFGWTSQAQTVVNIIVDSKDHNTLEAAVLTAGLAEALSGEGPFTIFAPTDAAFAALPAGTIEAILADPKGVLTSILTYHVVGYKAMSSELRNGQEVQSLNGANVKVSINEKGVFINNAQVVIADIMASNGIIHVIDAVILPPAEKQ